MILDAQNRYSNAQAITATAVSTDVIDHGSARQLGVGNDLWIVVVVVLAFTDTGSDSTVTVTLETDDNEGFSSALVTRTLGTFAALSAIGARLTLRLGEGDINEQFSRLNYTVAGGSLTTGSITAGIVKDLQAFTAYADAITIS